MRVAIALGALYWIWGIVATIVIQVDDVRKTRRAFADSPENWSSLTVSDVFCLAVSTLFLAQLYSVFEVVYQANTKFKRITIWKDRPK